MNFYNIRELFTQCPWLFHTWLRHTMNRLARRVGKSHRSGEEGDIWGQLGKFRIQRRRQENFMWAELQNFCYVVTCRAHCFSQFFACCVVSFHVSWCKTSRIYTFVLKTWHKWHFWLSLADAVLLSSVESSNLTRILISFSFEIVQHFSDF